MSSDPIPLHSKEDIEVYNIITPNGDGKNDFYRLPDALAGSGFSIYNRWGDLIYESHAYENNWSADDVVSGVYFYIINNKCFGIYKGVLTIGK
jgi:gliding motility-associated-like protein